MPPQGKEGGPGLEHLLDSMCMLAAQTKPFLMATNRVQTTNSRSQSICICHRHNGALSLYNLADVGWQHCNINTAMGCFAPIKLGKMRQPFPLVTWHFGFGKNIWRHGNSIYVSMSHDNMDDCTNRCSNKVLFNYHTLAAAVSLARDSDNMTDYPANFELTILHPDDSAIQGQGQNEVGWTSWYRNTQHKQNQNSGECGN